MNIVHLVDDVNYVETNCYQHQLYQALKTTADIKTVTVVELSQTLKNVDLVISCLKQRTVNRLSSQIRTFVNDAPIVFYDQDPWQAYMDDSPYKSTYDLIRWKNLKAIAVTTEWWANYIKLDGLPGVFVRMGMLPEYCFLGPSFEDRKHKTAFIGTLHPRRKKLVSDLSSLGVNITTRHNNLSYKDYLRELSSVGIFVHNEDEPITICGLRDNMGRGLWIKDVEAAARGCFSIRNMFDGYESYCSEIPTIMCFEDPVHARDLINEITYMNPYKREELRVASVEKIQNENSWKLTAQKLIDVGLTNEQIL